MRDEQPAATVVDYTGPDPSVGCAYPPCINRLRKSDFDGPQWCSQEHREASTRLRQLVEESQGGGYTSWVDQYGKEVVGLDTHQCLVDDHTEMGRLVLDLLEGEE